MFEGSKTSKILFISDFPRDREIKEAKVLAGERRELLINALKRAGILESDYSFYSILALPSKRLDKASLDLLKLHISNHSHNIIVPLGEFAFNALTGLDGVNKWHLSILQSKAEFGGKKLMPMLHPDKVVKNYTDIAYISAGAFKLKKEMMSPELSTLKRTYLTNLTIPMFKDYINDVLLKTDLLAVDIETADNQITVMGFCGKEHESCAFRTDTKLYSPKEFHELFTYFKILLSGPLSKTLQNAAYDVQYLSKYGIYVKNITHDTMWAQQFMYSELEKGLDNVARLNTPYPYWKDEGYIKDAAKNWDQHLVYNCKDTQATRCAAIYQINSLKESGLLNTFQNSIMPRLEPIREMMTNGLTVSMDKLLEAKEQAARAFSAQLEYFDNECMERIGRKVNPNSPVQLKSAFKEMKLVTPTRAGKESVDKRSLLKMKRKYPKELIIKHLIELNSENKKVDTLSNFKFSNDKGQIRYSIDPSGNEMGEWRYYKDCFGNGMNPTEIPYFANKIFCASPDHKLLKISLDQPEIRIIAYQSADSKLIDMLNLYTDINKYIGSKIFSKDESMLKYNEIRCAESLIKAVAYKTVVRQFTEENFVYNGISLTEVQARNMYFIVEQEFTGFRRMHKEVESRIRTSKTIQTPFGRRRIFFDRISDKLFKEAYAFTPKSMSSDLISNLMIKVSPFCKPLMIKDYSLIAEISKPEQIDKIIEISIRSSWLPEMRMMGGFLKMPITIETSDNLGKMERL